MKESKRPEEATISITLSQAHAILSVLRQGELHDALAARLKAAESLHPITQQIVDRVEAAIKRRIIQDGDEAFVFLDNFKYDAIYLEQAVEYFKKLGFKDAHIGRLEVYPQFWLSGPPKSYIAKILQEE